MMQEISNRDAVASTNSLAPPVNEITNPPVQGEATDENETKTDDGKDNSAVWNWIKSASNNQFIQKVMEKTKTGVDHMITTLDPGMAPYIKEGGDINIVVGSDKEVKWGAVRDAFQSVFGAAMVTGVAAQSNIAPQPVGYAAANKGAQERIAHLRKSGLVQEKQVCIAIENFIVEQLTDQWYDIGCIVLQDPANNITIELFTMAVPVDSDVIHEAQKATPHDYGLRWSGLSMTIGEAVQKKFPWVKPSDWHKAITGVSRRDIIYSSAVCVAEIYKRKLPNKTFEQDV